MRRAAYRRLMRICSSLEGSSITHSLPWKDLSSRKLSLMPVWAHSASNIFMASDTTIEGWTRTGVIIIKFESSFDKVSTSSIMRFWCREQETMVWSDSMHVATSANLDGSQVVRACAKFSNLQLVKKSDGQVSALYDCRKRIAKFVRCGVDKATFSQ